MQELIHCYFNSELLTYYNDYSKKTQEVRKSSTVGGTSGPRMTVNQFFLEINNRLRRFPNKNKNSIISKIF